MVDRGAFHVVDEFEKRVAAYCGAPHCVAVDSCTNALFLAFRLRKVRPLAQVPFPEEIWIPRRTYAGVYQAGVNAGYRVRFCDMTWKGIYIIGPIRVVDAARRFTSGMYTPGMIYCLSFQASKILPIGKGGAILCEDKEDADWLRKARFDGRDQETSLYDQEEFGEGYHMYLPPHDAARGIWLMHGMNSHNPDQEAQYPDLSVKRWSR